MIGDRPMIQWVYERASIALPEVWVATDDVRIRRAVEDFGGRAVMTSSAHSSGTSRVAEAVAAVSDHADVVINIQGDEPFLNTSHIDALMQCFGADDDVQIATLVHRFPASLGYDALADPNIIKVVRDNAGYALYFSRSIIPSLSPVPTHLWLEKTPYYTHIGIYAYRRHVLKEIAALPVGELQSAEHLEQLNWLQSGYRILTTEVSDPTIGVDTPEDLERARLFIQN